MSLLAAREYFKQYLEQLGYEEWPDGFNIENIPSTVLDGAYHVESGTIVQNSQNQRDLDLGCIEIVRIFKKGFRYPSRAIDEAHIEVQTFLELVLDATNRGAQPPTNVILNSIDFLPLTIDNDNALMVEMNFNVRINIGIN